MSADGQSASMDPVTPEGGEAKQSPTGADAKKKVDPKPGDVKDGATKETNSPEKVVESEDTVEEEVVAEAEEVSNDFATIFEGMDLSEDFKEKASLVFEAAVNEAAAEKTASLTEEIENNLREEFDTALNESIEEIVENLDGYLDYVVKEWMEDNEVAIESGIKVEMAESFMDGLKELFYEHNVEVDEETIDIVAGLEEELEKAKNTANKAINSSMELEEELQALRAEKVFSEMTEGLSAAQVERFRVLSEKLDHSDLDEYKDDLGTLKESFFKAKKETVISEDLDREGEELITEEAKTKPASAYDSVNAYAQAIASLK
jgi:hypothetical protein